MKYVTFFYGIPVEDTSNCLAPGRVDGRIGYAPHGLNVGGEPCVWCGGGPGTPGGPWRAEGPGGVLEESWRSQGQYVSLTMKIPSGKLT